MFFLSQRSKTVHPQIIGFKSTCIRTHELWGPPQRWNLATALGGGSLWINLHDFCRSSHKFQMISLKLHPKTPIGVNGDAPKLIFGHAKQWQNSGNATFGPFFSGVMLRSCCRLSCHGCPVQKDCDPKPFVLGQRWSMKSFSLGWKSWKKMEDMEDTPTLDTRHHTLKPAKSVPWRNLGSKSNGVSYFIGNLIGRRC